jgi:hypothetical protein
MSDKPTHADELDCLRLHNAALKLAEAKNIALMAETAFAHALAACERKYDFEHNRGEGIDFSTGAINRVKHGD